MEADGNNEGEPRQRWQRVAMGGRNARGGKGQQGAPEAIHLASRVE